MVPTAAASRWVCRCGFCAEHCVGGDAGHGEQVGELAVQAQAGRGDNGAAKLENTVLG
jgi:hypothetical protein